ncbi:SDR family NAD(P)-dependent oxidoreductase [Planctomonas psychrotolerans]|uniref:SDR family NAD(P)-dependent oxidoreductase n=1 Tax=Planctomonas psychrotolerans TaxID=2528712 RepID=UPI00123C7661|nr:SDR family NAD(P)-dependent oxidoreductase [Planctomonas psychrotolerans]
MSRTSRRHRNQVVVITGASSGIGRATAHAFAKRGASVVLAARNADDLVDVVVECRRLGGQAISVPTDVSDEDAVIALAEAAVAAFGRIDVWVGNASVFAYGTFEDIPADVFEKIMATNLHGQVYGARAVLPQFRAQGHGVLVLVASIYSKIATPYVSPYVTSKFGLLGFGEVLRQELRKAKGIDVSLVLPATIDTPIYQQAANYTGGNVHPLPPAVAPERVARVIVRQARRPRPVTYVGRAQRLAEPLRALPTRLYDLSTTATMDVMALRGGTVEPTPGNVLETQPRGNATHGGWRVPRSRLLALAGVAGAMAIAIRAGRGGR